MEKVKIGICTLFLSYFLIGCVTNQGFVRNDIEGSESARNRKDYKIGTMRTCTQKAVMGSLLFGIIRLNEHDVRAMYNKCIDATSKEINEPVIGFFESRGNFKITRIPGILTGGLIGIRFYNITLTGQPYMTKDDKMLESSH